MHILLIVHDGCHVEYLFLQKQLSLEVALLNSMLHIRVMRHDFPNPVIVKIQDDIPGPDNNIDIQFSRNGYRINRRIIGRQDAGFFDDLTNVQAWFGGVRTDLLQL